ncbi:Transposon Tf2-6 polyprotein, partial [Caligus rogercresseyi]
MPNTRSEGAMKEEDQTPTDPVQLMMAMMKEMKEEAKKREDQLMRQLQEQAQDFAAALQTNRGNAGGSTKSKKMDVPVLKCPEDINLADFRDWQQRFADYTEVQKIMEECTLSGRQSLLRSGLDPAWTKLWSTGILEIDDRKDDINDIIKKILHYIREHRNPLLDRKEFLERNQHAGESIDVYYSALKSIDESCGYDVNPTCKVCDDACGHGDELQQERLRDRLICGLKDQAIQQKVLAIPFKDLTLKKALEVCRVEAASKETQASLNKSERQVNRLKERSSYKKGKIDNNPLSKSAQKADERSEPKKEVNRMTIGQVKTSDDLVKITAKIGNADHQEVEWLPDTGAECDVITADCLKKVGTKVKDLRKDKAELCGPDQGRLKSLGKVTATLEREGMKYKTELHVLEKGTGPILSKAGCIALGLIPTGWPHVVNKLSLSSPDEGNGVDMLLKSQSAASIREQLFQEFPEVFPPDDEVLPLKPMKGPPMKIELLPGTSPIRRYRCNTIPLHWQDKVKAHLETMVQKQIIERVPQGEAPEWLFSMVVVPKAGTDEPRVTVDFSPLNPFVKRPMYPCRVPAEEVAQIPPGMTHFTVLDGRHGYWQVLLDKPSSKIMTSKHPMGNVPLPEECHGTHLRRDEFNRRGDDAIAVSLRPKLLTTSDPRSCRSSSYLVKTESGRLYWRNRRYLKLYAPPIGVAKDIPESQEEVKQPRRSKRQKKAP